jgi:hypothetical protein
MTYQFELTQEEYKNYINERGYNNVVIDILQLKNKHVFYMGLGDIFIFNVTRIHPGKHGHAKFWIEYLAYQDKNKKNEIDLKVNTVSIFTQYKVLDN